VTRVHIEGLHAKLVVLHHLLLYARAVFDFGTQPSSDSKLDRTFPRYTLISSLDLEKIVVPTSKELEPQLAGDKGPTLQRAWPVTNCTPTHKFPQRFCAPSHVAPSPLEHPDGVSVPHTCCVPRASAG
jgi:hypothetical protein